MSPAGIWSSNFHQLRNTFGNSCAQSLFRFQKIVVSQKSFGYRRGRFQPINTRAGSRKQSPDSTDSCESVDFNHLDESVGSSTISIKQPGYEFQKVQYYNIQRRVTDDRVTVWPAVVLVFDIETTGFSRKNERIIEIAIRDLLGGKNSTFQTLINPEKAVLNSNIHGITTRMVSRPDVPRYVDETRI